MSTTGRSAQDPASSGDESQPFHRAVTPLAPLFCSVNAMNATSSADRSEVVLSARGRSMQSAAVLFAGEPRADLPAHHSLHVVVALIL